MMRVEFLEFVGVSNIEYSVNERHIIINEFTFNDKKFSYKKTNDDVESILLKNCVYIKIDGRLIYEKNKKEVYEDNDYMFGE